MAHGTNCVGHIAGNGSWGNAPLGNAACTSLVVGPPKQHLKTFLHAPIASLLCLVHINISMTFPRSGYMLSPTFVPCVVLVFSNGCPYAYCLGQRLTTTSYWHFKLWSPMINSLSYSEFKSTFP